MSSPPRPAKPKPRNGRDSDTEIENLLFFASLSAPNARAEMRRENVPDELDHLPSDLADWLHRGDESAGDAVK